MIPPTGLGRGKGTPRSVSIQGAALKSSYCGQSESHAAQAPALPAPLTQEGGEAQTGPGQPAQIAGLARAESEFRTPPQPLSTSAPGLARLFTSNHNFKIAIVTVIK